MPAKTRHLISELFSYIPDTIDGLSEEAIIEYFGARTEKETVVCVLTWMVSAEELIRRGRVLYKPGN